ncbi:MAG: HNH endonuclease signature motif containing protein [Burkholderiaceae bacterium]|nr:HNH endonuclease signature motif containing protein [Burkholderiaceae bacterium]
MPSKQDSIDKRFALVDTAGELRYPYKKSQRATGKRGFVVGNDRQGEGLYLDNLEEVIHSVVVDGRRLRVTVDPPTKGKGSNGLSLHAMREVQGYVIAEELSYLVAGASVAPLGTPADYPRPASIPDSSLFAVCGVVSAADLTRLAADGDGSCLIRPANWSTVANELEARPVGMPPIPFFLVEEGAVAGALWVADIQSVRRSAGPSALVMLGSLAKLLEPIACELLTNFHTGRPVTEHMQADVPCVMSAGVVEALAQRLPAQVFEGEPLRPEASQAARDLAEDSECAQLPETVRIVLANARVGQGGYRTRMLKLWGAQCAVTECAIEKVLVASHAKSWVESTNLQRLDEYNGLLLSASLDKLFDGGLVAFSDDGQLLVSKALSDADLESVGLSRAWRLRMVAPHHLAYLQAHRQKHSL